MMRRTSRTGRGALLPAILTVAIAMPVLGVACVGSSDASRSGVTLNDPVDLGSAATAAAAPNVALAADGSRSVAWVSTVHSDSDTTGGLYVSTDNGTPVLIRDTLGNIPAHGESPPKLAYDNHNVLHAVYVVGKEVPGRRFPMSALRYVRSTDHGATWSQPVSVTDASVFGSYNFHALHVADDGTVYVSWLDGRDGSSATYMTRSTDGGASWAPNVRVAASESCPCCRTAIATASDGTLYLAWRTLMEGNIRDIVVARSDNGGKSWGQEVRVHADDWVFDACPHAGPSIQVDANGRLHVLWWTGKEGSAGAWYANSDDRGATFGAPTALGVDQFSRPAHVQLAVGGDGLVVAVWDDGTLESPQVVMRYSTDGGASFGAPQRLSEGTVASTFPVFALDGRDGSGDGSAGRKFTALWVEEEAQAEPSTMPSSRVVLRTGAVK